MAFAIIKDDIDTYVWTEDSLSDEEKTNFKNSYSFIAYDEVLTGEEVSSENTKFINGYSIFQLSDENELTIELGEENEINISNDYGDNFHVVYGTFAPYRQYALYATGKGVNELESGTLTVNVSKEKSVSEYFINYFKMAKKYSVYASGNNVVGDDSYNLEATCLKSITTDEYVLDVVTEVKNYEYYSETVNKSLYNLLIEANVKENKLDKEDTEYKKVPPTGDTNNMVLPVAGLATSSLVLAGYALTKKRKRY